MFLVQLLLPSYDNDRRLFTKAEYDRISAELTDRFGGLTAYTRVPAEGHWKPGLEPASRDEIVVLEVMCEVLDRFWWKGYREDLEKVFRQKEVVVRAQSITLL